MKNLFKYAASYWKAMIAILLILVVQAYCDLSLPAYTSDIVNVGIQQGGIEDEVPRQIATEEMGKLLLFVSEDDQQTVMDAYTEDNTSTTRVPNLIPITVNPYYNKLVVHVGNLGVDSIDSVTWKETQAKSNVFSILLAFQTLSSRQLNNRGFSLIILKLGRTISDV